MLASIRGGSNLGCLVVLAIIAVGGFVGYRFALVQWDYEGFKEEFTETIRYWVMQENANPVTIKKEIIRKAERHNFTINEEDIEITKLESGILKVDVYWITPMEFPGGYVYNREFSINRMIKRY